MGDRAIDWVGLTQGWAVARLGPISSSGGGCVAQGGWLVVSLSLSLRAAQPGQAEIAAPPPSLKRDTSCNHSARAPSFYPFH